MKKLRRGFVLTVTLSLACSGQSPTAPEPVAVEDFTQEQGTSNPARRPAPRVVPPRGVPERKLITGIWGGDHAGLTIDTSGFGTLEFDCAAGTIDQPFLVDSNGRFNLSGTYTQGHGGPSQIDEIPDKHPALYTGSTDGRTMTLTVSLTDVNRTFGPFDLTLGGSPKAIKCV